MTSHIYFISRNLVAVKRNAFIFEEAAFLGDEFAVAMTGETAEASVGGHDTVARHFRRERVTPQRLSDGLRPSLPAPRFLYFRPRLRRWVYRSPPRLLSAQTCWYMRS